MHSHLPSRVPRCIWNALCHFQNIHANIFLMYILTKLIHTIRVIQFTINNTKISSHGLITIQAIHFESPNNTKNHTTNHVNSETLGSTLFTATQVGISSLGSKILRPITRPSRPQQILIHKKDLSQRISQVGKDPYLLELSELHKIGAHT